MIAPQLDIAPESRALLRRLEKLVPNECRRALGLSASIVARKMRARMNPKRGMVSPWDAITARIKEARHAPQTFGGKLMHPRGKQLAVKRGGADGVVVGWIGPLEHWADLFQEGGPAEMSTSFRHFLYARGVKHYEVEARPQTTPTRPVVGPIEVEAGRDFPGWFLGALRKILAKRIRGLEIKYRQNAATAAGARAAMDEARAWSAVAAMGD